MGKSFMSIMNDIVMKNLRNLLHIIENTVMKFWHNHEIQVWNYGGLQKKSELFRSPTLSRNSTTKRENPRNRRFSHTQTETSPKDFQ